MTAQNLTLERIYESDETFNFSPEKNCIILNNNIGNISKGILLALYGDDEINAGKVSYSFTKGDKKYTVNRNFDENKVELLLNDEILLNTKTKVDEYIKELIGLDKEAYAKLIVINSDEAFTTFSDPVTVLNKALDIYSVGEDAIIDKFNAYQTELSDIAVKTAYLETLKSDESSTNAKIAALNEEIANINTDLDEVNRKLFMANGLAENKAMLDGLKNKLAQTQNANSDITNYKNLINNSEKVEKAIFLIEKNSAVAEENKTIEGNIAAMSARLTKMQKEADKGDKTLKLLESNYLYLNEKTTEIKNQYEGYVLDGVDSSAAASDFNQKLTAYYADVDKKITDLQTEKDGLDAEYSTLLSDIATTSASLAEVKYSYTKKKAIREGMVFETMLSEKEKFLKYLEKAIQDYRSRLEALHADVEQNEKTISEAKAKTVNALGREFAVDEIYADLNKNELQKQTLYRNQILVANVQREITAVDNKIYENEEAQRSYIEDRTALENAKSTLLGYIKKLTDKLADINKKIMLVGVQKKYFENIDALEFGDKCPVCQGQVLDKKDNLKESQKTDKAYADLLIEQQKTFLVKTDYDAQLDRVSLRLGELASRVNTSETYIKSLRETKEAKMAFITKLYELSGVTTFSELTEQLDIAIKKVAINTNEIVDLRNFVSIKKIADSAIETALKEIKNIEEALLPQALSMHVQIEDEIAGGNEGLTSLSSELGELKALEQADDIITREASEDELIPLIAELTDKKVQLSEKIHSVSAEILKLTYRDNSVLVNDLTYPQLVVKIIKDRFDEYFKMLNNAEAEKQQAQDQYVATSRVVKAKYEAIDALAKEAEAMLAKVQSNNSMITLLNENLGFNSEEYKTSNIDILRKEILDEQQLSSMRASIEANEGAAAVLACQIKAIEENIELNRTYIDTYAENCSIKNSLIDILNEKQNMVLAEISIKSLNAFIFENITELNEKTASTKTKELILTALKYKDSEYLVKMAGDNLFTLTKGHYSLKTVDGKTVIIDNSNNGVILTNPTEELTILAGICCERAIDQIINEISVADLCRILFVKTESFNDNNNLENLLTWVKQWNALVLLNK